MVTRIDHQSQNCAGQIPTFGTPSPEPSPRCGVIAPPVIVPGSGPLDPVANALVNHLPTFEATLTELRQLVEEAVL
jgi:hypothetical protein